MKIEVLEARSIKQGQRRAMRFPETKDHNKVARESRKLSVAAHATESRDYYWL